MSTPRIGKSLVLLALGCLGSCQFQGPVAPGEPVPGAPTDVIVTAGNGEVTVSWTAPASDDGSVITVTAVEDTSRHCTTQAASCVVTGLSNGMTYTFVVRAVNGAGGGPVSPPSSPVTPQPPRPGPTVPSAPTGAAATAGNAQATISWIAPAFDGGSAVTGYLVASTEDPGKNCQTAGALSCTVNGLTNGSAYVFTVVAVNASGASQASAPTSAVIPGPPADFGSNWIKPAPSISANLRAVIWTGSQLVAVGSGGTAVTSPDGLTWTPHDMGVTTTFSGVAWTGSLLVAVGESGAIRTSPDGVTWTGRASGVTGAIFNLTWTGSQAAAVDAGGNVLTSPDGIAWTARATATTGALYNIEWTGSLLVAVGAGGFIETSPDGIHWTARASTTTAALYGSAWTGNRMVVVGANGTVRTSPDGVTWASLASGAAGATFYAVTEGGGYQFYAGSDLYRSNGTEVVALSTGRIASAWYGVAWTGTRIVAVGVGGGIIATP